MIKADLIDRINSLREQINELQQIIDSSLDEKQHIAEFIKKYSVEITVETKLNFGKVLTKLDETISCARIFKEDIQRELDECVNILGNFYNSLVHIEVD